MNRGAGLGGGVLSAVWYAGDPGLFVTGSANHWVRVWDSRRQEPARSWPLDSAVYSVHMSPTRQHALLAVGSADERIRLCDVRTGASTHMLIGHSDRVLCCRWSPTEPSLLASACGTLCRGVDAFRKVRLSMRSFASRSHTALLPSTRSRQDHSPVGRSLLPRLYPYFRSNELPVGNQVSQESS